ncbi:MAG: hypothetical protein OEU32_18525 [Acidimicrobiia bacterium]|nr:hypothetical protein [Acidimicrobiia bacterium]
MCSTDNDPWANASEADGSWVSVSARRARTNDVPAKPELEATRRVAGGFALGALGDRPGHRRRPAAQSDVSAKPKLEATRRVAVVIERIDNRKQSTLTRVDGGPQPGQVSQLVAHASPISGNRHGTQVIDPVLEHATPPGMLCAFD